MPTVVNPGEIVVDRLATLGVSCELVDVHEAPQVIRVSLRPANSERMLDFVRLRRADDLAAALESSPVRIEAPLPGTGLVGVEFARKDRQLIGLEDLPDGTYPLCAPIGVGVDGDPVILDLAQAPQTLIAGSTGAGKSSLLHTILAQLLRSHAPTQLQMILIDTKRVELAAWESAPHLAAPIAEDAQTAIKQLRGVVGYMEQTYGKLRALGVRNIAEANLADAGIPYALVMIDELAELVMTSRGEVESLLVRIAQKGRAAGVHMVVATQYPLASCVTGLIRVNTPTKICMAVTDQTASRLVIGQNGGEKLLGKGDGLLSFGGLPPQRFQAAVTTNDEIKRTIERWKI